MSNEHNRIRCKMRCQSKTFAGFAASEGAERGAPLFTYVLEPEHSPDPGSENAKFWAFTPAGSLTLTCVLEQAFQVGGWWYIDCSPAPEDAHA